MNEWPVSWIDEAPGMAEYEVRDSGSSLPVEVRDRHPSTVETGARQLLKASARKRLFDLGPQALSEAELLSMVLRTGGRVCPHHKAAQLLAAFGSLRALILADKNTARVKGLNEPSHAALQAVLEIARRHYQELMMVGPALSNPRATHE